MNTDKPYKRKMSPFDKVLDDFFRNYQDRGMKKWAGFFLSDHRVKLNKDEVKRKIVYHKKPEMTADQIGAVLLKAFSQHYAVEVQLKDIDADGQFAPDIVGFVEGYQDAGTINIGHHAVKLDEINNAQLAQTGPKKEPAKNQTLL